MERKRNEKIDSVVPKASPPAIDPSTVETLQYDPYGGAPDDGIMTIPNDDPNHPYNTENSWWKVEQFVKEHHVEQVLDPCEKIPPARQSGHTFSACRRS